MTMPSEVRTWSLPFGEPPDLRFSTNYAAVTLTPLADGEEARLEASGRDLNRIRISIDKDGDAVRVVVDQEIEWFSLQWPSELRLILHVPRNVRASVRSNAGTIDAQGFDGGAITLDSDAGRLSLNDSRGQIRLETKGGEIRGRGIGGSLNVNTKAGNVNLEVVALDPGTHRVNAEVGQIRLRLAPDLDVKVDAQSVIGSIRERYPLKPNAAATLEVTTKVGAVTVEPIT